MKKDDVTIEGVSLNIKHLQGLSQTEFAEKMNGPSYKHYWADSENRDAIVAEAYSQLNPKGEATATAPDAATAEGTDTTTEATGKPGRRK